MNLTYLENLSFADKMMTMILTLGYHAQVGVSAHAYNPSPWGGKESRSNPRPVWATRKFKVRLGYIVQTCLKIKSSSSIGDTYIQWLTLMKEKSRKGKGHWRQETMTTQFKSGTIWRRKIFEFRASETENFCCFKLPSLWVIYYSSTRRHFQDLCIMAVDLTNAVSDQHMIPHLFVMKVRN